ncbi:MAG: ABC transporter permease [Actinobacteria bacterium]|nr:ABC transporter permease [Actinomycetota bacterium]
MTDLLPFIVVGLAAGSLYGLAGVGLTLTYTTTGVFNFAHGALAAAAAFVFFTLHVDWGWPWPLAVATAVVVVGALGGLVVERVTRNVSEADSAAGVVVTVGLMLAVQGLVQWHYGVTTRQVAPFLAGTTGHIGGVAVTAQQTAAIVIAAAATVGLFVFLRTSRLGTEMRAVVDNSSLLDLNGSNPNRVRTAAWMIGSSFAALTGVLIAPFLGLDASLLTLLVVQAFGAVAVGRFRSLPLTYAGGIAIGVGAALLTKWVGGHTVLAGLPAALPFLVLFLALVIWPPPALARQAAGGVSTRRTIAMPLKAKAGAGIVTAALVIAVPRLVGAKLPTFTSGAGFVIVFVSLALLVRTSGQISLCHASFGAVGATSFAYFASSSGLHLPWFLALVLAGLAVVPLGAVVAIPAIRLSGLHLALATFGFAILMERVAYPSALMFGALGLRRAPRPSFATGDTQLFYVTVAVAAAVCGLVVVITRTRLGRLLRGLAESPLALNTNGLNVSVARIVVFAISAFLAGIGGALFAAATGSVNGHSFGSFNSLLYLVILAVAGRALIPSAIVAAVALAVAPAYLPNAFVEYQGLIFGFTTVVLVLATTVRVNARSTRVVARLGANPVRARLVESGAST